MSMKLNVRDFLGIEVADLEVQSGTTVEVRSPNSTGKTSLATAIRGIMSHNPDPLGFGRQRKAYIREGADPSRSRVTVTLGERGATWFVKSGTVSSTTDMPSPLNDEQLAVVGGDYDFGAEQKAAARHEMMNILFGTPSIAVDALREHAGPFSDSEWESAVEDLNHDAVDGRMEPDAAARHAKYLGDQNRNLKRQWEEISGTRYGSRKAVEGADYWVPAEWIADFDGRSLNELKKAASDIGEQAQEAQNVGFITEARASEIKEYRKELMKTQGDLKVARQRHEVAAKKLDDIESVQDATGTLVKENRRIWDAAKARLAQVDTPYVCPECGVDLLIVNGKLVKGVSEEEMNGLAMEVQQAADAWNEAYRDNAQVVDERDKARAHEQEAEAYVKRLEADERHLKLAAAIGKELNIETHEQRQHAEELKEQHLRACGIVDNKVQVLKAKVIHEEIAWRTRVIKGLAPDGSVWSGQEGERANRQAVWCSTLRTASEEASWPMVSMDSEGIVSVGGRPVQACSGSERWIARMICKAAAAIMLGLPVLVLDQGDILDNSRRAGLDKLLTRINKSGMHTILATSVSNDGPISLVSVAQTYTIGNGRLSKLSPM